DSTNKARRMSEKSPFPESITPGSEQGSNPSELSPTRYQHLEETQAYRGPAEFFSPPEGQDELGRLGNYRVLKELGAGGMGAVFAAEDVQLKRPVALKIIRPGLGEDASTRQRFLREAQAAAAIRHDHIITIYQVGEDRGVPFLAMELLQGESLEDRL